MANLLGPRPRRQADNPNAVPIGTAPCGSVWYVYPKGETEEAFRARIESNEEALERHWVRRIASRKEAYTVRLTPGQVGVLEDILTPGSLEGIDRYRSKIVGSGTVLMDIVDELEDVDDGEFERQIEQGANKELTEAQVAFGAARKVLAAKKAMKAIIAALTIPEE